MQIIRGWYTNIIQSWKEASKDETFKYYFVLNFFISLGLYFATMHWVRMNSNRTGRVLDDPLYHLLTPHNFSAPIFFFTYSAVIIFLLYIVQYPLLLIRAFNSFVAVFMIRALCIHFIPLSPAAGIIVLNDPITGAIADESHVLNDLFFSGHIGDLMTFYFLCSNKLLRRYIMLCVCLVGTMLVWQRVHYTFDVMAAPVFSYLCYYVLVKKDIFWGDYLHKPMQQQVSGFHK